MKTANASAPSQVRVRWDAFDALCTERGWVTDLAKAGGLGVSHPHLSRIRSGQYGPGAKFIAQTLITLGVPFERVFERVA